jgi:hypothetical protein
MSKRLGENGTIVALTAFHLDKLTRDLRATLPAVSLHGSTLRLGTLNRRYRSSRPNRRAF